MSSFQKLDDLSEIELETIDAICIAFEDQWLAGQNPAIDEFLDQGPDQLKPSLLGELLKLDIEYRKRNGQALTAADYEVQFPDQHEAIDTAYSPNPNREPPLDDRSNGNKLLPDRITFTSEFQIERFHARGGLGEIHLAHDCRLGRQVAIKVPRDRNAESLSNARLQREAEITSRLVHPGIVPIYATRDARDGMPCYAMQFIEGQTLRDAVIGFHAAEQTGRANRFRRPEFRRLLQRLIAVGNAVAYAHGQGVIHRDIKPSNVMLGEFGETFLLDWGMAKVLDAGEIHTPSPLSAGNQTTDHESWRFCADTTVEATKPGQPIGTPEYASPEQVQGKVMDQDGRSDIYSLGATLYFLLLGKRAIELEDLTDLKTATAIRNVVPPKQIDPDVPSDLNAICMKAIAFEARDRFQTAIEFSEELDRYLADEPIRTRQENWPTRARRWMKKKPRTAYGIASGLSVALLSLAVSSWFFSRQAEKLTDALEVQTQTSRELQTAKNAAEASAQKTRQALRTMSGRMVRHWFAGQRDFSENERRFLEDILAQYLEFSQSESGVLSQRTTQAEGWQRVGQIQELLGRNYDALDSWSKTVELLTPLPANPDPEIRVMKATTESDLGRMLFIDGQIQTGLQTSKRAIEGLESLVDDFPDALDYQVKLAVAQGKLGWMHTRDRKPETAIKLFTAAAETFRALVDREPDNVEYRGLQAAYLTKLAIAHLDHGDYEAAIRNHQAAAAVFRELDRKNVIFTELDRASGYAMNTSGLGMVLFRLQRNEEAMEAWRQAISVATRLTESWPSYADGLLALASANRGLHVVYREQGNYMKSAEFAHLAAVTANKAVAMSPGKRDYLAMRSDSQQAYGSSLWLSGDLEGAESALLEGVPWARETHEFEKGVDSRIELARMIFVLGKTQFERGKTEAALENFDETVFLLESGEEFDVPGSPVNDVLKSVSHDLATTWFTAGDFERSLKNWNRLLSLSVDPGMEARVMRAACLAVLDAEAALAEIQLLTKEATKSRHLFLLARSAALAGGKLPDDVQRTAVADVALQLLDRVDKLGFFNSPEAIAALDDSFFDSIREHEEFKQLTDSLEDR